MRLPITTLFLFFFLGAITAQKPYFIDGPFQGEASEQKAKVNAVGVHVKDAEVKAKIISDVEIGNTDVPDGCQ